MARSHHLHVLATDLGKHELHTICCAVSHVTCLLLRVANRNLSDVGRDSISIRRRIQVSEVFKPSAAQSGPKDLEGIRHGADAANEDDPG